MINEEISDQKLVNSEPYYQYLLNSKSTTQLDSKKGSFFISISGDGKVTKKKISVTLNSTNIDNEQTVKFSEVTVDGYANNHDFKILSATSKTKLTDDCYTILTMEFSYTKPAHYLAQGDYSNKVDGYRFNFRKYTLDNSGSSTVNNTGHNKNDTTEVINLQINIANCGINRTDDKYVASKATGYINLYKNYYSSLTIDPNGGTHKGNKSTYTYDTKVCGSVANIEYPTRDGYTFTGWTISKGSGCSGATFDFNNNKFTYCGKSKTTTNVSSSNTVILKANWKRIEKFVLPEAGSINMDLIFLIIGIWIIIIRRIFIK